VLFRTSCEHGIALATLSPTQYLYEMPESTKRKREAADDLRSFRARRLCRVAASNACVQSRATRRAIEPTSIQSIIRDNSRDRLFVPPIAWTSKHLWLLDCTFVLRDSPVHGSREQNSSLWGTNEPQLLSDLRRAMTQLRARRTLHVKKSAIQEVLHAYDFCPYG
jgi:hypothetical protein